MMNTSVVEEVRFPVANGSMQAWMCKPKENAEAAPAVLVIHEIYGLLENLKAILQRFADNGYVAFAPNLYDKPGSRRLCVAKTMATMASGRGEAVQDLHSALEYMRAMEGVDANRLAATGFCMGGGFALIMAVNSDIKATAPYYGGSPSFLLDAEKSCPVVAGYAQKDALTRNWAPRIEKVLERAGIDHDIKTYPEAGHAYMTEEASGFVHDLAKYWPLKVSYRADDAEDSWQRMLKCVLMGVEGAKRAQRPRLLILIIARVTQSDPIST